MKTDAFVYVSGHSVDDIHHALRAAGLNVEVKHAKRKPRTGYLRDSIIHVKVPDDNFSERLNEAHVAVEKSLGSPDRVNGGYCWYNARYKSPPKRGQRGVTGLFRLEDDLFLERTRIRFIPDYTRP